MKSSLNDAWRHFTCKRYSELASKSLDAPLSALERASFYLHHVLCTFCRRSKRQLDLLERGCCQILEDEESLSKYCDHSLDEEAKAKIRRNIAERLK